MNVNMPIHTIPSKCIDSRQPTTKRIAREARNAKKQYQLRSREERIFEIDRIYSKLQELGISSDMVNDFRKVADDYIEHGVSSNGYCHVLRTNHELVYVLVMNKNIPVSSILRSCK